VISAAAFHAGELGLAYTPVSPIAKGGVPPYVWAVADGALPAGLQMTAAGKVTGTPTILGTYLFTVRVTDSMGSTSFIQSSISVARRVVVTGNPCTKVSPCSVEAGCLTVCGVFGFLSGGIPPYKYKVTSGALPTGMGLSGFSLTKAFPAAPAAGKDWVFTVRVTDAIGAWAETTAKFHVFPHIAFTPPIPVPTCTGKWGTGCTLTQSLGYILGTPGLGQATAKVVAGLSSLPFVVQGLAVTGIGANTNPCPLNGYVVDVRVVVQDTSTCGANLYCASVPATVKVRLSC
jgi:hypothetical protein